MKRKIFTLLFALFSVIAIQAQVRYVTEKGSGTKDGSSWENASKDIQEMINELAGGGTIYIAQGVYIPTKKIAEEDVDHVKTTERDKAFLLHSGISLYGGYVGEGSNPDERDFDKYTTVLSGAINKADTAYHVVVAVKADNVILDGFTITNGRALYSFEDAKGENLGIGESFANVELNSLSVGRTEAGGLYANTCSSLQLTNLKIGYNWAGYGPGFVIKNSDFELEHSFVENNQNIVGMSGGGYIESCTSVLKNVSFRSNHLNADQFGGGGALFQQYGTLRIEDSVFENNKSIRHGALQINGTTEAILERVYVKNNVGGLGNNKLGAGGIYAFVSLTCKDVWVTGNTGSQGGAFQLNSTHMDFDNVTIERNVVNTNSNIESGYGGAIFLFFQDDNNGDFKITNSTIRNNYAEALGGAIYAKTGRNYDFDITNTVIENNKAEIDGGALYLEHIIFNNFNMNIKNSLIAGNEVVGTDKPSPSILYIDQSKPIMLSLTNTTVVNNKVTGNGFTVKDHANVMMKNSILWGNQNGNEVDADIDAATEGNITYSLINGFDLEAYNGLKANDGSISANDVFANFSIGDYLLKTSSPAIGSGEAGVDMGAYEYQATPLFKGGVLESDGSHLFIYTGEPIGLQLINVQADALITYSWSGDDNGSENTVGIVNAGEYTVTATVGLNTYDVNVTVVKKHLNISLDGVLMMERLLDGSAEECNLSASYDKDFFGDLGTFTYEYSSGKETVASLEGNKLTAVKSGHSLISAKVINADPLILRNYEIGEGLAIATVLPYIIDGSTTPTVDETEIDDEVIIRGGVTFEDDVIFHEEVTIEGEPTNFNGGAIFEEEAEISGEVNFNNPDKDVIFEKEVSFVDPNAKTTFESDVIFYDDVDFAGDVEFKGDATFKGEAEFDGEAIFNNEGSEAIFEKEATFNDKAVFEGDVTFQDEVTFEGETEFNGSATFENGANFTNEVPVFNGDLTVTGDITLPTGETLTIDNDGNTITIEGEGSFSENVIINGGTLVLGELTVDGDLDINGVTVQVTPGASLNADKINGTPKSIIDLSEMPVGINDGLTVGILANGVTPDDLFDVNGSSTISYSWTDNGSGSYTLVVTRVSDPVLYTVSYSAESGSLEVSHNGIAIASGASVDAGVSLSISATSNVAGMVLKSLTVNGVEVENNSSITITGNTDIVAVFELEGTDPNPDPTGNAEIAEGDIRITVDNGQLTVDNERGEAIDVTIYNLRGQVMVQRKVDATATFTLPTGFYLVKAGKETVKVVVK